MLIIDSLGKFSTKGKFTMRLMAEGITIFDGTPVLHAVSGFIALHFIFNMKYRKEMATIGAMELLFGLKSSIKSVRHNFKAFLKCME